jgi:hypothetical protein
MLEPIVMEAEVKITYPVRVLVDIDESVHTDDDGARYVDVFLSVPNETNEDAMLNEVMFAENNIQLYLKDTTSSWGDALESALTELRQQLEGNDETETEFDTEVDFMGDDNVKATLKDIVDVMKKIIEKEGTN